MQHTFLCLYVFFFSYLLDYLYADIDAFQPGATEGLA